MCADGLGFSIVLAVSPDVQDWDWFTTDVTWLAADSGPHAFVHTTYLHGRHRGAALRLALTFYKSLDRRPRTALRACSSDTADSTS
jgi:hypothetical protein